MCDLHAPGPGFCRVVGLVKVGILLACAAAATNINRLRSWVAAVSNTTIDLAQPDPPSSRSDAAAPGWVPCSSLASASSWASATIAKSAW